MRRLILAQVLLWITVSAGCSPADSGPSNADQSEGEKMSSRDVNGTHSKPRSGTEQPDWAKLPLPDLYERYAKRARAQVDAGSSWIVPDFELFDVLVERVPDNKAFFLEKLREDPTVALYVLNQSTIAAANRDKLEGDMEHEERVWLSLLREDGAPSPMR